MDTLSIMLSALCEKYALGTIQGEPQAVKGGLLHQMYHVTTDRDNYAIKLLNPDIMKRPRAMENMIDSERVARRLAQGPGALPVVAALERGQQQLLSVDMARSSSSDSVRQYALVYPWIEARSLFAPEISVSHCGRIGHILGQIHGMKLDPETLGIKPEELRRPLYDWQGYLTLAKEQETPWISEYESMLPNLTRWDRAATGAMESVGSCQIVSHRDLDPKNVLWQDDQPYLIDWEAAGAVNPYQELLEVLNYWCNDENGRLAFPLCQALLHEYTLFMDLRDVDWAPVFAVSCDGMLGWLEYTLKKALGIEKDEDAQGVSQMTGTYRELLRYETQTGQLREILEASI